MNPTLELLYAHRSIRKFTNQRVSDETVNHIIKAAQSASTSSFLQAYSIIDVSDPVLRSKLRVLCGDQEYVESAPLFLVFCGDLHRLKTVCDLEADKHDIYTQSTYESGLTESFIIATIDAALAGQNALLAAESMGMGGVYIGGIRNNPKEVSDLLYLPDEVYPVFGLCLGYPDQDPLVKERLPQEIVYHTNRYASVDEASLESYDKRISAYYHTRTDGKIDDTWSKSVFKKFAGEKREHMMTFLQSKGFIKR